MTKNILLAAASVAVLGFAGAAGASEITGVATTTFAGVTTIGTNNPVELASELTYDDDVTGPFSGLFEVELTPTTGAFPNGQAVVTITFTNATFSEDLDNLDVNDGGVASTCGATGIAISTGGGKGDNVVSYFVTGLDACSGGIGDGLFIQLPILIGEGDTSAVSVGVTSGGITADAGPAVATILNLAEAFDVDIQADTAANQTVSLEDGYTTLSVAGDNNIGNVAVTVDTGVLVDLSTATAASSADLTDVTYTLVGNRSGLEFDLDSADGSETFDEADGDVLVPGGGSFTLAEAANGTAENILFSDLSGADDAIINGGAFSLDVLLDLDGQFTNKTVSGPLQSIDRDGTSVIVPWIGSASQSGNGVVSQLRVANNGTGPAGSVFAAVLSSTTGDAGPLVEIDDGILAGDELLVTQAALEAALGNWGRGDLLIVVEAEPEALSIKRRDTRNGVTSEISLGSALNDSNND